MNLTSSSTIQIKSNDIIQLILQYLQQNKLLTSFKTLQQQSGITLNQINQKQFIQAFKTQNWSYVIQDLATLMLSQELFFTIYEFICDSLIEKNQFQAAAFILEEVIKPNIKQMAVYRQRIMRIQYIIQHTDQKNLYKKPPSPQRQSSIIKQILSSTTESQPQRLLKLLTQSLKYQVSQGLITPTIKLNLFNGQQQMTTTEPQTIIKQIQKTVAYTEQSKVTQLKISWTEEYLAIGGVDGLIQLYNTKDYSLYDNQYQRQGQMFFHDYPIQAIEFNYTDEMMASVDTKGIVNIWNLKNGKLLRKIDKESFVNVICWGVDPSHLLVGYKENIKLYGIRSCNILKQYKTNLPEFIQTMFVTQTHIYTFSTTGTLTIFNYITCQISSSIETKQKTLACFRLFNDNTTWILSKFMIAFKKRIIEYDQQGIQLKGYPIQDGQVQNCIAVGQFLYVCVKGSDNKFRLSVIEKAKKKVVFYMGLESQFQKMMMLRKRNLLITYDEKHKLSFWRPG